MMLRVFYLFATFRWRKALRVLRHRATPATGAPLGTHEARAAVRAAEAAWARREAWHARQ